jgi:hypothetical protein
MGSIFSEDKNPPGTLSEAETARIIAERRGDAPPSCRRGGKGLFGSWKLALGIVAILLAYNGYTIWKGEQKEKQATLEQASPETQIEAEAPVSTKPLPYFYTVDELVEDYAEKPNSSTAEYTGKYIKVTGDAEDFGATEEGLRYVIMNSDNRPGDLRCVFSKDQGAFLDTLERGDYLKVVGQSKGIVSSRLLFTDCKEI